MAAGLGTSLYRIVTLCLCFIYSIGMMGAANGWADEPPWKAGVASVAITPEKPMWMAGYGARTAPSQGTLHDLFIKALALEDGDGNRAVIVTADLIGLTLDFSDRVAAEAERRYNLPREALFLNASHTHCGPEVRAERKPFYDGLDDDESAKIDRYLARLEREYIEVIGSAINALAPSELAFAEAKPVPFAVNRRRPTPEGIVYRSAPSSYYTGGPRDDISPVLAVRRPDDGSLKAVVFGYACHPITLYIQKFCGDYPGFAQRYIEEAYPGVTALFVQGCAGQLVPNARYQVEYAEGHGRALADAVVKALDGEMHGIEGPIRMAYENVAVQYDPPPDRGTLLEDAQSDEHARTRKARLLLDRLDRGETIETAMPCPTQVMRFGNDILLVGLAGEPVAEYAVNIKAAYAGCGFTWVAGYCTWEFGYLPTWRIIREGGYEGGGAMLHTPFPGPLAGDVEKRVLDGVDRLVARVMK